MTYQKARTIATRFITRHAHMKGTGAFLHPVEVAFTIRVACHGLNRNGFVIDEEDMTELVETINGCFEKKIVLCETDEFKDDLCALAGYPVADVILLHGTTLEAFCGHVKLEAERWLFEQEYKARVWLDRVEAACEDQRAAIQVA